MVADVVAKFGRLDIAVNNAGIEIKKTFLDVTDDEWNTVIGVNLFGVLPRQPRRGAADGQAGAAAAS